jgi:hypothetical protein
MWDTNYPECLAEATWLVLVGMTKHLAFEATLHENKWQSQGHGNLSTLSPSKSSQVACHHTPFRFS